MLIWINEFIFVLASPWSEHVVESVISHLTLLSYFWFVRYRFVFFFSYSALLSIELYLVVFFLVHNKEVRAFHMSIVLRLKSACHMAMVLWASIFFNKFETKVHKGVKPFFFNFKKGLYCLTLLNGSATSFYPWDSTVKIYKF